MDAFNRLSDYDVFAYLPQGFFALAAIDYLFGTAFVIHASWDVPKGVLVIFSAYAGGHIIASPSSRFIERWLVHGIMGQPALHLLKAEKKPKFWGWVFNDYYTPLADPVRLKILNKLKQPEIGSEQGESLFWTAYPVAKKDEPTQKRLSTFINLYGFCRNVSFVAITSALAILLQQIWFVCRTEASWETERIAVALCIFALGIAMFQRFLKFYRLYSVEVFTTFSSSD